MALLERPAANPEYVLYWVVNNVNDKVYVGQTCKGLKRRWHQHKDAAAHGSDTRFHAALRKYGSDSFEIREVGTASSKEQTDQLEKIWILLLQSHLPNYGYNSTFGGDGVDHTPETKQKLSERGRVWHGLNLSDDKIRQMYLEMKSTRKIAEALGCGSVTVWNRLKRMGVELRQGPYSPELPNTAEWCRKLAAKNVGRVRPQREKDAISAAHKNRVFSAEHLSNLRKSAAKRKTEGNGQYRCVSIKKEDE